MKVFATKFLESLSSENITDVEQWIWEPHNKEIAEIYASGAKTSTKASTYAAEKDSNADTDRPNEGD
jgi:hypothetical protein